MFIEFNFIWKVEVLILLKSIMKYITKINLKHCWNIPINIGFGLKGLLTQNR